MGENLLGIIVDAYRRIHLRALQVTADLSSEQLNQRAGENAPPMAFHLWHVARWADFLQEVLTESGNQLWTKERLADVWGMSKSTLGYAETGYGMEDNSLASPFLPKESLLHYAQRAFAAAEQAVVSLDSERMLSVYNGPRAAEYYGGEQTFAYIILRSIGHESRHVGNIECLRGVMGFS